MSKEYIATPKRLKALLARHGFRLKKNFGQNFLIDTNILHKIIDAAQIDKKTIALEIGPGVGSLTQLLGDVAKQVESFEIDQQLEPLLAETLADYANVHIHFTDFLKLDLPAWYQTLDISPTETIKVVANLPYYITTPILEKLIVWSVTDEPQLTSATVMMQKEVAQRLNAKPGTKEYGSLSIFLQLFTDVAIAFDVSKKVFIPEPNVDSSIVHVTFKKQAYFKTYEEAEAFLAFVRICFATRRKTLYNNLKGTFAPADIVRALQEEHVPENVRAEALSIDQFIAIFKSLDATLTKK